jgi:hypothetical protein
VDEGTILVGEFCFGEVKQVEDDHIIIDVLDFNATNITTEMDITQNLKRTSSIPSDRVLLSNLKLMRLANEDTWKSDSWEYGVTWQRWNETPVILTSETLYQD